MFIFLVKSIAYHMYNNAKVISIKMCNSENSMLYNYKRIREGKVMIVCLVTLRISAPTFSSRILNMSCRHVHREINASTGESSCRQLGDLCN